MKMSAKPFKKTRAQFLLDAHKVKRLNWCLEVKRKKSLASVCCFISQNLSRMCRRSDEDVAKISPPKHCPYLDGLHFPLSNAKNSSLSITKPNSCPKIDGPQKWGYKKYGLPTSHQEDVYGLTKTTNNRQHFTLTRRKWWRELFLPLIPNTRNDTAYDGLMPYCLLPPQP